MKNSSRSTGSSCCTVRMSWGDPLRRVAWKPQDVSGIGDDPLSAPGEKHLAVFVHPVLLFLGLQQIVGVDLFEPDKDPLAAGARGSLDKIKDTKRSRHS